MLLLALLACAGDPKGDTGDTATREPTFTNVQAEVFTASCAFSSCHGSSGGGASDLDLSEGNAYDEIVNVASVDNPDATLIVPGDAANSYLVQKSTPGAEGLVGGLMPEGTTGLEAKRLALLVAWVDAGAPSD